MIKAKLVFYIPAFNPIGGMEQWIYYLSKKYSCEYDITVIYRKHQNDEEQIERLSKLVKCIDYNNQEIECDKAFFCYNFDIINKIKANDYNLILHSDYETRKLFIEIPKQINHIYAVSEVAKKGFERTHKSQIDKLNLKVEILYNPIILDEPKKVLKIISPTRLTYEKGRERMKIFNKMANELGYLIEWLVFTDSPEEIREKGFAYLKPTLDILGFVKEAHYLAQFSLTEAYGYSPIEALMLGIPVLITNMPIVKELNIKDGENGYILPFELFEKGTKEQWKEIFEKIFNNIPKGFKYSPPQSDDKWLEVLGTKIKSNYDYRKELKKMVEVQVIVNTGFYDVQHNGMYREYESTFICKRDRADGLIKLGYIKIIRVIDEEEQITETEVEEVKETNKEEPIKPIKKKQIKK